MEVTTHPSSAEAAVEPVLKATSFSEVASMRGQEMINVRVGKAKEFFNKIWKGVQIIEAMQDPQIRKLAKERLGEKADIAWLKAKAELGTRKKNLAESVNKASNGLNNTIDKQIESLGNKGKEVMKGPLNMIGRSFLVPVIEHSVYPALKTADDIHKITSEATAKSWEWEAKPVEMAVAISKWFTDASVLEIALETTERYSRENNIDWLNKIYYRIDGLIMKVRRTAGGMTSDALMMRAEAARLRQEYSKANLERRKMKGAAVSMVGSLQNGI